MAQNPYTELGVAKGASADEIRKAFRKLAKDFHPDRNPGNKPAEERFKRVSAAFDILGDEEKRKKFDRGEIDADGREAHPGFARGGNPFQNGSFRGGGGPQGGFGGAGAEFDGVNFDDILGQMFRQGGHAGGPGAGGGGPRGFSGKGADLRARLEIDLEDSINGATRRITFGDGRDLDVTIPKGAGEGQVLRLRGQGQPGRSGGPAGDALIELGIKPHPIYRIDGADLHMDLPVSIPDAVLGAKVDAPTPSGPVTLTVPRHANAGAVLRLKGRGAVGPKGGRGDLFAHLVLTLPEDADPTLDAFAEEWRRKRPYAPRRKG